MQEKNPEVVDLFTQEQKNGIVFKNEEIQEYKNPVGIMEPPVPMQQEATQKKGENLLQMPEAFRTELMNVFSWTDLNKESSQPVADACRALFRTEGHDSEEFRENLQKLAEVCHTYLGQKERQWHWWFGDGRRRMRSVRNIIRYAESYFSGNMQMHAPERAKEDEKARTKRMLKEQKAALNETDEKLILHYQAKELLPLLSDNKQAETQDEEKALSVKDFNKAVRMLKDIDLGEVRVGNIREMMIYATQNDKAIRRWKKLGDTVDRGLAQDMDISEEDLTLVMSSRKAVDEIQNHIDLMIRRCANYYYANTAGEAELNSPEYKEYADLQKEYNESAIAKAKKTAEIKTLCDAEISKEKDADFNDLNLRYKMGHSHMAHKIVNLEDRRKKYEELNVMNDPEVLAEFEKKKVRSTVDPTKLHVRIVDQTLAEHGDERVVYYDASLQKDSLDAKNRWVHYMQRRAKGKLIGRAKAVSAAKKDELVKTFEDLKSGKEIDKASFTATLRSLIIKDAKEIQRMEEEFIKKPEKYMLRIELLSVVQKYMNTLLDRRDELGLSEKEVNSLLMSRFVSEDAEKRNEDIINTYDTGEGCFFEPEEISDKTFRTNVNDYCTHLKRRKTKEAEERSDRIRKVFEVQKRISGMEELDSEATFLQETVDASQTILNDADKQVEEALTQTDDTKAFTEKEYEEYKKNWLKKYNSANRLHEKLGLSTVPKSQTAIIEARQKMHADLKQKKIAFDASTYSDTVKTIFKKKAEALDNALKKTSASFLTGSVFYSDDAFEKDKKKALKILEGGVLLFNRQIQAMGNIDQAGDAIEWLTSRRDKLLKMRSGIEKLEYDAYMDIAAIENVQNWLQLCDTDEDTVNLRQERLSHLKDLYDGTLEGVKNGSIMEDVNRVKQEDVRKEYATYTENRRKNHPVHDAKKELQDEINGILAMPDEELEEKLGENNNDWGLLLPGNKDANQRINEVLNKTCLSTEMDDVKKIAELRGLHDGSALRYMRLGSDDVTAVLFYLQRIMNDPGFAKEMKIDDPAFIESLKVKWSKIMVLAAISTDINLGNDADLVLNTAKLSENKKALADKIIKRYKTMKKAFKETSMNVAMIRIGVFIRETSVELLKHGADLKVGISEDKLKSYMPDARILADLGDLKLSKDVTLGGKKYSVNGELSFEEGFAEKQLNKEEEERLAAIIKDYNEVNTKKNSVSRFLRTKDRKVDTSAFNEEQKRAVESTIKMEDVSLRAFSLNMEYFYLKDREDEILGRLKELQDDVKKRVI